MDLSVYTDPHRFGPGAWFKLLSDAIRAVNDLLKEAFVINTQAFCDQFRCKTCQGHYQKYIDSHPIKDYWNRKDKNGNDIGMFLWTWEFYNAVNTRLGKKIIPFEEAYKFYTEQDQGACFKCGEETTEEDPLPPFLTVYQPRDPVSFRLVSRN
jgi:hypothetical protein